VRGAIYRSGAESAKRGTAGIYTSMGIRIVLLAAPELALKKQIFKIYVAAGYLIPFLNH
jgi:hypothetical protein